MDMRLTVVMPVYDDFCGAVFTVKSLEFNDQAHIKQFILVNNNPRSPDGAMLEQWANANFSKDRLRHEALMGVTGTAITKQVAMSLAAEGPVLCCDSHVLFPPGAINDLRRYFEFNPDCKDLIQGPLIYDNNDHSTHFDFSIWESEMWGQWQKAFIRHDGIPIQLSRRADGMGEVQSIMNHEPWKLDSEIPIGVEGNAELVRRGFIPGIDYHQPFEIPGSGMGVFACMKDAWLGFNYQFKGFGGEEGYIHEKYRKAGHKVLCHPKLRWWHRFGRPQGMTYPINRFDKLRNYIIGFKELGLNLEPLHFYWVGGRVVTQEDWDNIESGRYTPEVSVSAPVKSCGSCQPPEITLDTLYERLCASPSDINEHLPTLRELAAGCNTVVEFGTRTAVSTTALLAGRPKLLMSYDINDSVQVKGLAKLAERNDLTFEFYVMDSLLVEIEEEIDLLFIDTKHTMDHLHQELTLHGKKAKRIVFHDTETFGYKGEDGGPGIKNAILTFMQNNPEYSTIRHDMNNNGLTVISRIPEEQPKKLPSTFRMAKNFFKSTWNDIRNGLARVPLEVAQERYAICTSNGGRCPAKMRRIDDDRCADCGCFLMTDPTFIPGKTVPPKCFRPMDACPLGYWSRYEPDEVEGLPEEAAK